MCDKVGMVSKKIDEREDDHHRRIRAAAFFAVVISTVAVVVSVITLPMLYNYVQSLQSHMMAEADYCKVFIVGNSENSNTCFISVKM